jgi:hypothetical protein
MTEEWHPTCYTFYGNGENCFVFSMERVKRKGEFESEDIIIYDPTFLNDKYQCSDEKSLTIGGSKHGDSCLYISNNFKHGYSSVNDTFNNPNLSREKDFLIMKFEVWGFDEL